MRAGGSCGMRGRLRRPPCTGHARPQRRRQAAIGVGTVAASSVAAVLDDPRSRRSDQPSDAGLTLPPTTKPVGARQPLAPLARRRPRVIHPPRTNAWDDVPSTTSTTSVPAVGDTPSRETLHVVARLAGAHPMTSRAFAHWRTTPRDELPAHTLSLAHAGLRAGPAQFPVPHSEYCAFRLPRGSAQAPACRRRRRWA